jgi:hypothetical protein
VKVIFFVFVDMDAKPPDPAVDAMERQEVDTPVSTEIGQSSQDDTADNSGGEVKGQVTSSDSSIVAPSEHESEDVKERVNDSGVGTGDSKAVLVITKANDSQETPAELLPPGDSNTNYNGPSNPHNDPDVTESADSRVPENCLNDGDKYDTISLGSHSPGGASSSVASSVTMSPLESPSKGPTTLLEKATQRDTENAQTLDDIQGDIRSAITQSLALISSNPPSATSSEIDISDASSDRSGNHMISNNDASLAQSQTQIHSTTAPGTNIEQNKNIGQSKNIEHGNNTVQDKSIGHSNNTVHEQSIGHSNNTGQDKSIGHSGPGDDGVSEDTRPVDNRVIFASETDSSDVLSELDSECDVSRQSRIITTSDSLCIEAPNGLKQVINLADIPEYKELRARNQQLEEQQEQMMSEIER